MRRLILSLISYLAKKRLQLQGESFQHIAFIPIISQQATFSTRKKASQHEPHPSWAWVCARPRSKRQSFNQDFQPSACLCFNQAVSRLWANPHLDMAWELYRSCWQLDHNKEGTHSTTAWCSGDLHQQTRLISLHLAVWWRASLSPACGRDR